MSDTNSINVRVRLNQILKEGGAIGSCAIPTGLSLSFDGNILTVAPGTATSDNFEFTLTDKLSKDITLPFEAGNNKGGLLLDNGTDTLYVFIISNGIIFDIAVSTELTPELPSPYILYKNIGYIVRASGEIVSAWPDKDLSTYWLNNEFNKALDLKATKESLAATDLKVTNNTIDITGIKSDIVDINKDIEGINTTLDGKQDKGDYALKTEVDQVKDDLATVTNTVDAQGTSLNELTTTVTGIQNNKADKSAVEAALADKQDKIEDLETIRSGAAKGATALQSYTETDPTVPAHVKAITAANISSWNDKQPAGDYATNDDLTNGLANKADKATTLAGYGISNAYTKTETDNAIKAINLIKWVDTLPTTGDTKYLYAIPRNEVDKDGKKIAALYFWDGTEWRGAGAFSLNIDPATLATKNELAGYLPLSGGTLTGQLKILKNTLLLSSSNDTKYVNISMGNDGFAYFSSKVYLPADSVVGSSKILGASDKSVANGVASLDANTKVPSEQIPVATASSFGGVKLEFDETTGTLNIKTEQ